MRRGGRQPAPDAALPALGAMTGGEELLLGYVDAYGRACLRRGGFWTYPGCPGALVGGEPQPIAYARDDAAQRLEARGLCERATDARGNTTLQRIA